MAVNEGNKRVKGDGKGRQGGRQTGTPNKVNKELRELLTDFSYDTWDEFVRTWKLIDKPEKKCEVWLAAQAYVTPKLSSVEVKTEDKKKSLQEELDSLDVDLED